MKVSLFVLAIFVTILVHEFGHFIVAKLLRFRVAEFSIGIGPKIIQKRFRNTAYTLRAFPLGGYVSFQSKRDKLIPPLTGKFIEDIHWSRLLVVISGVLFNLLFVFGYLLFKATLVDQMNLISAINFSITTVVKFIKMTFDLMTNIDNYQSILGGAYQFSSQNTININATQLFILQIHSFNLSCSAFNILPFPTLDGGQFLIMLVENIAKRKIPQDTKSFINMICWIIIMGFFLWLTIRDLINIVF